MIMASRLAGVFVTLAAPAWAAPSLMALQPETGPDHTLVTVAGEGLAEAAVIWDAGLPTERLLTPTAYGAVFFSVPHGATPGAHPVRLKAASGTSTLATFTVAGETPAKWAKPRIDDISIYDARFESKSKVKLTLYVQGANFDAGSSVLVNGVEAPSQAHKILRTRLYGVAPEMLDYPIRHYLSRLVALPPLPTGATVNIQVRNAAGEVSRNRTFHLPKSPVMLDSDGDGLTDLEEVQGFDNGAGRIDLRSFGADPYRKDILLEFDLMKDLGSSPLSTPAAEANAFETARTVFANAPLLTPFGSSGINLYIDYSGTTPHVEILSLDGESAAGGTLRQLRAENFTPARRGAFHYAVWAQGFLNDASGASNADFDAGQFFGDSFVVALGAAGPEYQTLRARTETLVHELGHSLGQRHGGTDDFQYSPTYLSQMAYTWQLRASKGDDFRRIVATCTAFYYGDADFDELAKPGKSGKKVVIDYSEGMARTLTFGTASLDETIGVCGRPFDWNGDGQINPGPVEGQLYRKPALPPPWLFADFPNWRALRFDGPKHPVWSPQ